MNKNKWFYNPWILTLIGGPIAAALGSLMIDLFKGIHFFSSLKMFIGITWNLLYSLFTFKIELWVLLVFMLIIFLFFIFIKNIAINNKEDKILFLNYTTDKINGANWKWRYEYDFVQ